MKGVQKTRRKIKLEKSTSRSEDMDNGYSQKMGMEQLQKNTDHSEKMEEYETEEMKEILSEEIARDDDSRRA